MQLRMRKGCYVLRGFSMRLKVLLCSGKVATLKGFTFAIPFYFRSVELCDGKSA